MYQALYRKWRPRTFDDVVDQDHITATLRRQVETGRLSHAYLFIGTRGTGKTTCAKILARAVNCEHPVNGNPCNECAACRGIESGGILDVVELDAASNNGVSDVRALQDEAIFSPASVKKRVYIIDEVHMLSTAAFNALLKILEEPPEHLMFILCTTEIHKVLPTIVSRCQRHSFKRIGPEAIAGRLMYVAQQENLSLEPEAAALLARLADGGMRDALSLLDQCSAHEHIDVPAVHSAMGLAGSARIAELLKAICAGSVQEALTIFDQLWKDGKDPAGILDELSGLLRDVLLLQVAPNGCGSLLSGIHDEETLRRFAAGMSGSRLMDSMNAIRTADLSGANPRRVAEMCLVSLCVPETGESLAALRSRVSRLEAMLQNGGAVTAETPAPPSPEPKPPIIPEPKAPESPSPQPEEPPRFTDADAPPETAEQSFSVPDAPAPVSPPEPAPAAPELHAAPAGSDVWDTLVRRLNGKLEMGAYAMLSTASQTTGELHGSTLTVWLSSPIAKMMLDKPGTVSLFQQELLAITGEHIQVVFTDEKKPVPQPTEAGTDRFDALKSQFSGVLRFE